MTKALIVFGTRYGATSSTSEDIAKTIVGIVEGNIPYSTGEIIHIDGGFHLRRL